MTMLDIGQALRALGFSVIPVPRPRPGCPSGQPGDGKVPILPWRDFQQRLPTDDELVLWFGGEPCNIGIVTGAISGMVVVDADSEPARQWWAHRRPYTPWQTRTARGFHFWYQHPGMLVKNAAKIKTADGTQAIDVRGDGGYVIGPGSVHASGALYRFAGDWRRPRSEVPRFWPGWLRRSAPGSSSGGAPSTALVDRARSYLAAIPRPEIGAGSDLAVLTAAARLTRGFELPVEDATTLLWEWAGGRPGWTVEWVRQKAQNAQRYGTEPLGALR